MNPRPVIRRLTYADLPQVVAIERRVVPDAVVARDVRARAVQAVGHLPRGAARRAARRLPGLLALRHRLARDERRRRPRRSAAGDRAPRCSSALLERVGDERRALHARGAARRTTPAISLYERFGFRSAGVRRRYYQDNGEDALDHVAHAGDARRVARRRAQRVAGRPVILAHRDELRRHLRRGRHARRGDPLQRHLLAGHPRPLRRRRAGGRLAPPPRAGQRGRRRRARAGAAIDARRRRAWSRSPQGPGLVGALLVGVATAKALAAARRLPLAAVDHLHGHVAANFLAPDPFEPPFVCLIASGGHTLLARVDDRDRFEAARPDARRRRRRGVRQGRAPARPRLPRRPGAASASPREGDPGAFDFPTARQASPGLDFSFAGLKTALLYTGARPGRGRSARAPRRPRRLLPARDRRGAGAARRARAGARPACDRLAIGGGVAANGAAARAPGGPRRRAERPAARAVHRQRRDDRQRRALRARRSPSRTTSPSTPTPPASGPSRQRRRDGGRPLRPPGLPPVRRRARRARARPRRAPFTLDERDIDARRRAPARATSSGSRSSRSTARRCSSSSSTRRISGRWLARVQPA